MKSVKINPLTKTHERSRNLSCTYQAEPIVHIKENSRGVKSLNEIFFDVDQFSELINYLKQDQSNKKIATKLIVVHLPVNIKALQKFIKWKNQQALLRLIPVVVVRSNSDEDVSSLMVHLGLVDDIIKAEDAGDNSILLFKANFLNRVKSINLNRKKGRLLKFKTYHNSIFPGKDTMKRFSDILISLGLIVALSPVFLIIALIILFTSKGPIFYISKRAGKNYNIFNFYKFRTMHVGADKQLDEYVSMNQYDSADGSANFFKLEKDPRVTKFGQFLRNTSLDELPQLFNVLLGDMSLVGNRPLPLYEACTLTTNSWSERFCAPAGITGLWQVKKRGKSDMSAEERIALDIEYARRHDFFNDFKIIFSTPGALFQKAAV